MGREIQIIYNAIRALHAKKIYPTTAQINKYLNRTGPLSKAERAARTAIMRDLKIKKRKGAGKGPNMERDVCCQLSNWWEPGRDDIFWRTHGSGARATSRTKAGKKTMGQYGDVAAADPIGQPLIRAFTFSLKCGYPKATLHDLLDTTAGSATPIWRAWIDEIRKTAETAGTPFWAVIAKRDRRNTIIVLPRRCIKKLHMDPVAIIGSCIVERFSEFLYYTKPADIRELVK